MAFEFKLPDIGEGVVEGEIVRWLVSPGESVKRDQPMVEIMTDKATVEIPSPVEGTVAECIGEAGDIIDVGATLVVITVSGDVSPAPKTAPVREEKKAAAPARTAVRGTAEGGRYVQATPAIRKLARSKGIDLTHVEATGPRGRITADDISKHLERQATTTVTAAGEPGIEPTARTESLPYRGLRRKIGDRLTISKQTAVHYTYVEEVDVSALVDLRRRYLQQNPAGNLNYLPFILKAVVSGLKKYPTLNASLDEERGEILVKKYYNIGIATATKEGLIVPVVKAVDRKSIREVSADITRLVNSARKGKSSVEDLQDSTFTVTSLGPLGGLFATPVINYPEVAILGIHKIVKRPVVRDDQIVIREMMNLSISLDHRVVDGATAAEFMHSVIQLLETPGLMMLNDE